jgi:hypothetical protein
MKAMAIKKVERRTGKRRWRGTDMNPTSGLCSTLVPSPAPSFDPDVAAMDTVGGSAPGVAAMVAVGESPTPGFDPGVAARGTVGESSSPTSP